MSSEDRSALRARGRPRRPCGARPMRDTRAAAGELRRGGRGGVPAARRRPRPAGRGRRRAGVPGTDLLEGVYTLPVLLTARRRDDEGTERLAEAARAAARGARVRPRSSRTLVAIAGGATARSRRRSALARTALRRGAPSRTPRIPATWCADGLERYANTAHGRRAPIRRCRLPRGHDHASATSSSWGPGRPARRRPPRLARAGCDVLLLDRATFPRPKVCGDGLTPRAIVGLRALGVWGAVRPHATIVRELATLDRVRPGPCASGRLPSRVAGGPEFGAVVSRDVLDDRAPSQRRGGRRPLRPRAATCSAGRSRSDRRSTWRRSRFASRRPLDPGWKARGGRRGRRGEQSPRDAALVGERPGDAPRRRRPAVLGRRRPPRVHDLHPDRGSPGAALAGYGWIFAAGPRQGERRSRADRAPGAPGTFSVYRDFVAELAASDPRWETVRCRCGRLEGGALAAGLRAGHRRRRQRPVRRGRRRRDEPVHRRRDRPGDRQRIRRGRRDPVRPVGSAVDLRDRRTGTASSTGFPRRAQNVSWLPWVAARAGNLHAGVLARPGARGRRSSRRAARRVSLEEGPPRGAGPRLRAGAGLPSMRCGLRLARRRPLLASALRVRCNGRTLAGDWSRRAGCAVERRILDASLLRSQDQVDAVLCLVVLMVAVADDVGGGRP
jgi:hypothetical protein